VRRVGGRPAAEILNRRQWMWIPPARVLHCRSRNQEGGMPAGVQAGPGLPGIFPFVSRPAPRGDAGETTGAWRAGRYGFCSGPPSLLHASAWRCATESVTAPVARPAGQVLDRAVVGHEPGRQRARRQPCGSACAFHDRRRGSHVGIDAGVCGDTRKPPRRLHRQPRARIDDVVQLHAPAGPAPHARARAVRRPSR